MSSYLCNTTIESGIIPLDVTLRIDGSFSITNSSLNIIGPVQPTILSSSADEYRIKFVAEGIYYVTASATDSLGYVYQDTIAIMVFNKTQLDTMLKGKWEGMKGALAIQDVTTALNYFTEEAKQHYNELFTALQPSLPQIAQEMQGIELIRLKGNSAQYRIRRDDLYGGQIETITYYIYFMVDDNGIWRIDWY